MLSNPTRSFFTTRPLLRIVPWKLWSMICFVILYVTQSLTIESHLAFLLIHAPCVFLARGEIKAKKRTLHGHTHDVGLLDHSHDVGECVFVAMGCFSPLSVFGVLISRFSKDENTREVQIPADRNLFWNSCLVGEIELKTWCFRGLS